MSPIDSLDAAWAEAEAALPDGWIVYGVNLSLGDGPWQAVAGVRERDDSGRPFVAFGQHHDSPAAALRVLAAKLREGGS